MFGKNLPLKEKVRAAGAFGGIALATVMALDMMITGGYQMPGLDDLPELQPDANAERVVSLIDGGWQSEYAVTPIGWTDPLPMNEIVRDTQRATEELAGAFDAPQDGYRETRYDVPSEDELYREIAALYARQDERAAESRRRAEETAAVAEIRMQEEVRMQEELRDVEADVTAGEVELEADAVPYEDAPIAYEDAEPSASETE